MQKQDPHRPLVIPAGVVLAGSHRKLGHAVIVEVSESGQGTPEKVAQCAESYTGQFLARSLVNPKRRKRR